MNEKRKQPDRNRTELTDAERTAMKREFAAYLDTHPVHDRHAHIVSGPIARARHYLRTRLPVATIGIAVACVFTVSASEHALPNQSLYAVKTNVNERILLASTYLSPVLHAQAGHTVYARRLEEAEQLLLLEQLKAETADTMQSTIDAQEASLDRSIARAEAVGDETEAHDIRAHLAATRTTYDPILDILALRKEASDPSVIDNILDEVLRDHEPHLRPTPSATAVEAVKLAVVEEYTEALFSEIDTIHSNIALAIPPDANEHDSISSTTREHLARSNEARNEAERSLKKDPDRALTHARTALANAQIAFEAFATTTIATATSSPPVASSDATDTSASSTATSSDMTEEHATRTNDQE